MIRSLLTHEARVIAERDELLAKRKALTVFIDANTTFAILPKREQELLQQQEVLMSNYGHVLDQRIALFAGGAL